MAQNELLNLVIARIAEYVEPIDRGERYEDPLARVLEERGVGQVTGGGSQLDENFRISFVDIEMMLADLSDSLALVESTLNDLGVPVGSELLYEENGEQRSKQIGILEGLELYLDGVNLPAEVYEKLDFQSFYDDIAAALKAKNAGHPRSVWTGNEETGIFIFGPSADGIGDVLSGLVSKHPILQNSRLVFRRADSSKGLEEIRIPMQSA